MRIHCYISFQPRHNIFQDALELCVFLKQQEKFYEKCRQNSRRSENNCKQNFISYSTYITWFYKIMLILNVLKMTCISVWERHVMAHPRLKTGVCFVLGIEQ